jgi:hypothetical protein
MKLRLPGIGFDWFFAQCLKQAIIFQRDIFVEVSAQRGGEIVIGNEEMLG